MFHTFDQTTIRALRSELQAVLNRYGVDTNVVAKIGNIKYSPTEMRAPLTVTINGGMTKRQRDLEYQLHRHGLKTVSTDGTLELVEYNSRAGRYPWIYVVKNGLSAGKRFKTSTAYAITKFKA